MKRGNLMAGKKSQSHIEMILSFIIFTGFVLAIFIFINPSSEPAINPASFDDVQQKVLDYISKDYKYSSLVIKQDSPITGSCFSFEDTLNIAERILVRDSNGVIKKSKQNGDISIEKSGNSRFYELYFSDYFNAYSLDSGLCHELIKSNYSITILVNKNAIFYERIQELNKSYLEDYAQLKKDLNINADFTFAVYNFTRGVLFNESISKQKTIPPNVISREIPLKIFDKNASQRDIILNLRVWI